MPIAYVYVGIGSVVYGLVWFVLFAGIPHLDALEIELPHLNCAAERS